MPVDFVQHIARYIDEQALIPSESRVLVGVSGGVDSVVLAHVLHRRGFDIALAHVNYGLRGRTADGDERFVRAYGERLGVPVHVERVGALAERVKAEGASLQAEARTLRYQFFARQAQADGCARVAVGHHRDDQAETLLLNLLHGSGPEGLAGMAPERSLEAAPDIRLIRPLLETARAAIEAYAEAHDLVWREDATNQSTKYRRNALRAEVMPLLEEHFGAGVPATLARTAALLRAYVDDLLRPALNQHFATCAQEKKDGGALDGEILRAAPPVWRQRLILEALERWLPGASRSAAMAEEVDALLEAQVGRRVELGAGAVWRARGGLRFVPEAASSPIQPQKLPLGGAVETPVGIVRAHALDERPASLDPGTPRMAYADRGCLAFPLTVRSWKPGDRFRPLGMDGTKKVSDLLTDARVPPHRRAQTPVICSEGAVVWVVGHRLAHAARVRPSTEHFARFRLTSC